MLGQKEMKKGFWGAGNFFFYIFIREAELKIF